MKPIAIVGAHRETLFDAPYHDGITEIWAFNSSAMRMKRLDRAFQMHSRQIIAEESKEYNEWLRNTEIPVYMKERYKDIPASVAYPFDKVFSLTEKMQCKERPLRYFTSTLPFTIALAIVEDRPKISLYGIELALGEEWRNQREGVTFWTGFAGGRGIEIEINCAEGVFDKPIYGEIRK